MKALLLLLPMLATLSSCDKNYLSTVPDCIRQEIQAAKERKADNPPMSVWQYEYNGKQVYYIPSKCCDIPSKLIDQGCNTICNPDGGFSGKGDGKCADFFEQRKNEKLIWKDDR